MRWLVGWSSIAASFGTVGAVDAGDEGRTVHPVGSQLLWGDPDPLWAVGDWRPDEIRISTLETAEGTPTARLAVLGCCGATDEQLRLGLLAARGGALRHLTAWAGSYTAVVQIGRRVTVVGDLAGARPVFYTPWAAWHGVRDRRTPARRPDRGAAGHRPPGRAARLPRDTGGAA